MPSIRISSFPSKNTRISHHWDWTIWIVNMCTWVLILLLPPPKPSTLFEAQLHGLCSFPVPGGFRGRLSMWLQQRAKCLECFMVMFDSRCTGLSRLGACLPILTYINYLKTSEGIQFDQYENVQLLMFTWSCACCSRTSANFFGPKLSKVDWSTLTKRKFWEHLLRLSTMHFVFLSASFSHLLIKNCMLMHWASQRRSYPSISCNSVFRLRFLKRLLLKNMETPWK